MREGWGRGYPSGHMRGSYPLRPAMIRRMNSPTTLHAKRWTPG
ncbi:MAG: hypothetical protein ABSB80_00790 [Methanoregula sp.]